MIVEPFLRTLHPTKTFHFFCQYPTLLVISAFCFHFLSFSLAGAPTFSFTWEATAYGLLKTGRGLLCSKPIAAPDTRFSVPALVVG